MKLQDKLTKTKAFMLSPLPQPLPPPHLTHTAHEPFHLFYHLYKQYATLIAAPPALAGWRFAFAAAIAAWLLPTEQFLRGKKSY